MTRHINGVVIRPWKIGYIYKATLSHNNIAKTDYGHQRWGWRLTKTGLERYLRRSKKRRARRVRWHTRTWERMENFDDV